MAEPPRPLIREGFEVTPPLLSQTAQAAFLEAVTRHVPSFSENGAGPAGLRNLTALVPETLQLLEAVDVKKVIVDVLGPAARLVRAILFDKTAATNWNVPWHQDLFVAVARKHEVEGFGAWTVKDGVPHARPPIAFLETMAILRLHLDDCGSDNGPLLVIPRSHSAGLVDEQARRLAISRGPVTECKVAAGGALLMRPLLLHSSKQATKPARRRVVHLELAAQPLPSPLEWHLDIPVGR